MIFTKENLNELLRNNVVTITFTKVDGAERTMKCTLLGEYVPNAASNGRVLLNEDSTAQNISVWDVEANGWRSFRINSVKNVSVG
jgi:hypothetical protein